MARPARRLEAERPDVAPARPRRRWRGSRALRWGGGIAVALVLLLVAAEVALDEPLRRYMEWTLNERLTGYTVTLEGLDFHPLGFSVDFLGLVVTQQAHPDPPVARIPLISASVHWRALLSGGLVADFAVDGPVVHVNRAHLVKEAEDEVPVERRGWQEALQAMYPLEINLFRVRDGQATYADGTDARPLRLTQLRIRAENIRNIDSPERVYPSVLQAEAVVFGSGRVALDGNADFLATPHPGLLAKVRLENVELDYFRPILARYNFALRRGTLTAHGDVEYAPALKALHLEEAVLRNLEGDYVHAPQTRASQKTAQAARAARETAEQTANDPGVEMRIDRLRVTGADVGFVNRAAKPEYRVFLADLALSVRNLSNHFVNGPASATLQASFMGSGATSATATFRPEASGPDFDLDVKIEDTRLTDMNRLLLAHAKIDVTRGLFSLYSELRVKNRRIEGYVKPLFREMDVYDPRQDRDKGLLRKLYEGIVGGLAGLLENIPRDEVATRATVSGPVQNPNASTWEVVVRLIQNAFFRAILPGFEREAGRPSRERKD